MDPLFWSILLMAVGLTLVVVEVFHPTGGVLGVISVGGLVASIGLAFYQRGPEVGLVFLTVAAVGAPTVVVAAFRYWPRTPMGRRLLLGAPTSEEVLPDSPERRRLRDLVGKLGVAKSLMLPSGAVQVGGVVVDAISEGLPIEVGQRIKVIEVHGSRVVVRPADPDEPAAPAAADDLMSQSIESLGIDPFDEPLV